METRRFDSPPSLPPLYARAGLGSLLPGGAGDKLPDLTLELPEARIDADRLAAYGRVCGFALTGTLPLTYPHLLGFPLQMALMTERSFPFGLLGLVHIENRISQHAAIPAAATPAVSVRAENLRPHPKGRAVDLITEASLDGALAWAETSTYLRPGKGGREAAHGEEAVELVSHGEAKSRGPAAVWSVPGDIGRRYAEVSGDRNPIHLHSLAARPFGQPSAIAHGMWTLARTLAAFDGRLRAACTATATFRSPVRIPARISLLSEQTRDGWRASLVSADGERRHLDLAVEGAAE